MKLFIQSPDAHGRIDPPVENILRKSPGIVHSAHEATVILVPVTRLDNFKFDESLKLAHKPWVLVDFCELGWQWTQTKTHLWGQNTEDFSCFQDNLAEWQKFDQFVRDTPPALQLIRELVRTDRSDTVQPIDYLCNYPIPVPQTKEQFNARPFELFYSWGRSHEGRMSRHADIFDLAGRYGWEVVSEFKHMDLVLRTSSRNGPLVASVHAPWYARIPMEELLRYQEMSKVSVSMPGSGVKCFRHAEAPINAVMAMPPDDLAWSFPWDRTNSIRHNSLHTIVQDARSPDLYDIYRNGVDNACRYAPGHYHQHHTLPAIARVI